MNTCQTCQHWQKIKDKWPGYYGKCGLINEKSQANRAWLSRFTDEDLTLMTEPGFGCNQWQEKDKNE